MQSREHVPVCVCVCVRTLYSKSCWTIDVCLWAGLWEDGAEGAGGAESGW